MSTDKISTLYSCVCDQSFNKKSQIRKHVMLCKYAQNLGNLNTNSANKDLLQLAISKSEIQSIIEHQNPSGKEPNERFKCGCEKRFKSKGGYYRHIKKCKLRPEQQIVTGKTKCNEPGCILTFKYIRDFRQHLNEKHKIQFDVEEKKFKTYSDFLRWKENYETETCSCFYHRKTETRSGRRVEYWYCNRSGIYQSASHGRRRKLKSQGILKINNNCTSSITLTINKIEGTVQAIINHTHYGHEAELVHLRIPKSDKQEIASKLLQGVKIEDILLSYKEDGLCKQIERKHLIKRRDILNISKKYNVNIILPKIRTPSKNKKNDEHIEVEPHLNKDISLNTIETKKRHVIATQLSLSIVNPLHESSWIISTTNNSVSNQYNEDVYHVNKNDIICCSNECKMYCNTCNICYHSYSCTCNDFKLKEILCEHVHLVALFQVTPQTYQYEEKIDRPLYENQDHTNYTQHFSESINLSHPIENVLENNDYVPDKQNIKNLKIRLEKLMIDASQKINECNNCDLLESIERQMTDLTSNLSTDLLQNKKKMNETQTIITPEKSIEVYYVF